MSASASSSTAPSEQYRLPAQEDTVGTYMGNQDICHFVQKAITRGRQETDLSHAWSAILTFVFPTNEGFYFQREFPVGSARLDVAGCQIVRQGRTREYTFLIVECKRTGLETSLTTRRNAHQQLRDYLLTISTRVPRCHRFGALAIGRTVRFYELVGTELQPLADGEEFYLDRQCMTITRWLEYIRDNFL